jgi:hypothetical protein
LVPDRQNATLAHALREGCSRALSAPAVLVGTFAVARVFDVPADNPLLLVGSGVRPVAAWLLFWSLAYGGVLDRFARNRPTRGHGFFGACGAHVMPLLRLAIVILAGEFALLRGVSSIQPISGLANAAIVISLMIAAAIIALARVRLVVEDRRSAIGALLAAVRFARRNPAGLFIFVLFGFAAYGVKDVFAAAAPPGELWNDAFLAVQLTLTFIAYSSAVVLFQSRLAHAAYTAAPQLEWPESASVEAITNAPPRHGRAGTSP